MKVIFATWLEEPGQGKSLTKINALRRLLSYFFIKGRKDPSGEFIKYVEKGE